MFGKTNFFSGCSFKSKLIFLCRLCDGYDDCMEGEDENDCNCPEDKSFFCDMEPFDKSVCIDQVSTSSRQTFHIIIGQSFHL